MELRNLRQNPQSRFSQISLDLLEHEIAPRCRLTPGSTNGKSNKLLKEIKLQGLDRPMTLAIDGQNRLIVKEYDTDFLWFVDPQTSAMEKIDGVPGGMCQIAVNNKDDILLRLYPVRDSNKINIYNRQGQQILSIATDNTQRGIDDGCVACDAYDNIFMSDNECIFVYSAAGEFIKRITRENERFKPAAICTFRDRLLVIDDTKDYVVIFSTTGEFISEFPIGKSDPINYITCDGDANIIIAAIDANDVTIFSPIGKRLRGFDPASLPNLDVFYCWSHDGKLLKTYPAPLPIGIISPRGVVVDHEGHIWILDIKGSRLLQFD